MPAGRAELSSSAMRRRFAVDTTYVATPRAVFHVNLGARLATGTAPPPVPIEDAELHASQRVGSHQRVLVRPAGLADPTMTYLGDDPTVVRV